MQVAARADILDRRQVAALVMHAGETVANELLRDMRDPIAVALRVRVGAERRPLPYAVEDVARPIGHAAVERTAGIAIERSTRWIWRILGDLCQLERFAVVERRVAAAMTDDDGVLGRYLVQVVDVERALVLEL